MSTQSITRWHDPQAERLRARVVDAQSRLAELEAAFTSTQRQVQAVRALLFTHLRTDYERRDQLRLAVRYRKDFLDQLLADDGEQAAHVREQFTRAEADVKREYESAAEECATKKRLSTEEEEELKVLWKKLVKLFHPDRVYDDPEKQATYQKLTQAINAAKQGGDLDTLREIASDPDEFIRKRGWVAVELALEDDPDALRRLHEMLQQRIAEVMEATEQLRRSADYELHGLWQKDPGIIEGVVREQKQTIDAECRALAVEAERLRSCIEEVSGEPSLGTDSTD